MGEVNIQIEQQKNITPQILFGDVMHRRLFPKINGFNYRIYYLALPLSQIDTTKDLKIDKFAALSFYKKDHGDKKSGALTQWARDILDQYNVTKADGDIILICMPRIFGYVFNPISYWLCLDKQNQLRAVICEVNNTFGQTHSYLCVHDDERIITPQDHMIAEKIFHVSPFLKREGHYQFRFDWRPFVNDTGKKPRFGSWIDYYAVNGEKQLITSLIGRFDPLDKKNLRRAFWCYPLMTFKAVALIHWHALKLIAKSIKYVPKPQQKDKRLTKTDE